MVHSWKINSSHQPHIHWNIHTRCTKSTLVHTTNQFESTTLTTVKTPWWWHPWNAETCRRRFMRLFQCTGESNFSLSGELANVLILLCWIILFGCATSTKLSHNWRFYLSVCRSVSLSISLSLSPLACPPTSLASPQIPNDCRWTCVLHIRSKNFQVNLISGRVIIHNFILQEVA